LNDASNFRIGAAIRDPGDDRRREESEENAPTENDFNGFEHRVDANGKKETLIGIKRERRGRKTGGKTKEEKGIGG
jgi:hypothetical protein